MTVKLFVLGCSGSGKSTAARYIAMLARDAGWSAIHINDYRFLYEMFQADTKAEGKKFYPVAYGGFNVLDRSVYDIALLQVEQAVQYSYSKGSELIIIEFARNDYNRALKLFNKGLLRNACFLFLDSDPHTCIWRIHKRATHPTTIDDHFVPDYIVETYRHTDNRLYITTGLKMDFAINDWQITVVDNIGSWSEFGEKLEHFVDYILQTIPIPVAA